MELKQWLGHCKEEFLKAEAEMRQHNLLVADAGGGVGGSLMKLRTSLVARKKVKGADGKFHYTGDERTVYDKAVTDVFCEDIVDNLIAEVAAFGDYKYHESGTGTNAEAATDTDLQTPDGVGRATGTQVEGATAKEYKSIATITYDGTYAITEHGIFNTTNTSILMDRTVFSAINVENGNQIEFTFTIAFTSGG